MVTMTSYITEAMECIEKESSSKKKLELLTFALEKNSSREFEQFLRLSFNSDVLNIAAKSFDNALDIQSTIKHRDPGERVRWFLSQGNSLLEFSGVEGKKKNEWKQFLSLYEELKTTTGNNALLLIRLFFEECDPLDAKWFVRCLVKDLSCGVQATTVDKAFEKLGTKKLDSFDVSLCQLIECGSPEQMKDHIDEVLVQHIPIHIERKYDGIRLIVTNVSGMTRAISRNGKEITSVGGLIAEFNRFCGSDTMELDGELIAKDFQTLMTQVHRKNDLNVTLPRTYMVFDILSFNGVDLTKETYLSRRKFLEHIFSDRNSEMIKLVEGFAAVKREEVIEKYNSFVAEGCEGAILKANAPYTRDRSVWFKMKPVLSSEMKIVGLLPSEKGRNAGRLARLEVENRSGTVRSVVGSGVTDEMIDSLNSITRSFLVGHIVEIAYDSITKPNQDGIRSLRFPRFMCFREDKTEPDVM